jgi:phage terminase large subunit-like protein
VRRLYIHAMPWKDTPFKSELGDFPNGRHDDCIDAVAGAIHALSPHRIETAGLPVLNKNAVRTTAVPVSINAR